jgi:hypothetical protein
MTKGCSLLAGVMLCAFLFMVPVVADPVYLTKENMLRSLVTGIDTTRRFYHYRLNGILSSIIDSPSINSLGIATFNATCDSIGRLIKVDCRRNASDMPQWPMKMTTDYHWLTDHRVGYASRDTAGVIIDTGTIQANGTIRYLWLPQWEETLLPTILETQLIVIVSDSTKLFKGDSLITTYYWQFDSCGTDTAWLYRLPGGQKKSVESYTNIYYNNCVLYKRFPALLEVGSYCFYSLAVHTLPFDKQIDKRSRGYAIKKASPSLRQVYLPNGRAVPLPGKGYKIGATILTAPDAITLPLVRSRNVSP